MDDEKRFGQVLHRSTFAQAIAKDLLSDYQVVIVGVTDSEYRKMAERGVFVTPNGKTVTDARTLARQIGLLRAITNYDLHRVVTFHSRIDTASRFARLCTTRTLGFHADAAHRECCGRIMSPGR